MTHSAAPAAAAVKLAREMCAVRCCALSTGHSSNVEHGGALSVNETHDPASVGQGSTCNGRDAAHLLVGRAWSGVTGHREHVECDLDAA